MSAFNTISDYQTDKDVFEAIQSNLISFDFSVLYDSIRYQGFNRSEYMKEALKKLSLACLIKLAMLGAVRGSNFAKISRIPNLPSDVRMAMDNATIRNSKPTKATDLTITRCTAALPQWCAYSLLKANAPGRIPNSDLHACLQFPAAGSLPMSAKVRTLHIEFSDQFSSLIGGNFKPSIYKAMYNDRMSVNVIHSDMLTILGVTTDSDSEVDIDVLLSKYEDDVMEEVDVPTRRTTTGIKRQRR